jgi:ribonuclease P protein subunit RPR2
MVQTAQGRIADLFALAEVESRRPTSPYPDRYVGLARRIGMRYNVRVPREYRSRYCRQCSAHWVEGRTVRTRLRRGRRVESCLLCGAVRRVPLRRYVPRDAPREDLPPRAGFEEPAVATDSEEEFELDEGEGD